MEYYDPKDRPAQKKAANPQTFRLQETFLNHLRKEKITVIIQLFDQSIIEGLIIGFDQESIIVASRGSQQLLYKSSVVCVKPYEEVHLIFNEGRQATRTGVSYPRVLSPNSRRQH